MSPYNGSNYYSGLFSLPHLFCCFPFKSKQPQLWMTAALTLFKIEEKEQKSNVKGETALSCTPCSHSERNTPPGPSCQPREQAGM